MHSVNASDKEPSSPRRAIANRSIRRLRLPDSPILLTLILATAAWHGPAAEAPAPCVPPTYQPGDQVRLRLMTLDAGIQTFEVFRMPRQGAGEWARWTSAGHLLEYGSLPSSTAQTYEQIEHAIATAPQSALASEPGDPLGRPGRSLSLLQVADAAVSRRQSTSIPPALAGVLEHWRQVRVAVPLEPGLYLWTSPVPADSNAPADVDLADGPCRDTLEGDLAEALASDRLIFPAQQGIEDFFNGERAYRTTFSARISQGRLQFGMLTSR